MLGLCFLNTLCSLQAWSTRVFSGEVAAVSTRNTEEP